MRTAANDSDISKPSVFDVLQDRAEDRMRDARALLRKAAKLGECEEARALGAMAANKVAGAVFYHRIIPVAMLVYTPLQPR